MLPEVLDDAGAAQPAQPAVRRWRLRRRSRNTLLTIHIIVSVGLLGDSAGFLAVAIRRSLSNDPALVESSHQLLGMFALYFGIPLSILALLTGAALGLLTRWGVFRYPWVTAKLALNLSVILVGALVLRPVMDDDARRGHRPHRGRHLRRRRLDVCRRAKCVQAGQTIPTRPTRITSKVIVD
jgi:hypothetical protein